MYNFKRIDMNKIYVTLLMALSLVMASCSSDEPEVRSVSDIYGAWTDNTGSYFYFRYPNVCYKLVPESDDVAILDYDAYYYEPGYNFLLYVSVAHDDNDQIQPDIYSVTSLTDKEMTWVWADNLRDDKYDDMSSGEILGQIIKEAQEGFKLDYSRTSVFTKIETSEFKSLLEKYSYSYVIDEL